MKLTNIAIGTFLGMIYLLSMSLLMTTHYGFEVLNLVKPVTIMQYSGFLWVVWFLHNLKNIFWRLSEHTLEALIVIGFFAFMASFYEMLWSFFNWFTIYGIKQTSLDLIYYIPKEDALYSKMFLNFASKKNTLLMMISAYFTYFIHNIKNKKFIYG